MNLSNIIAHLTLLHIIAHVTFEDFIWVGNSTGSSTMPAGTAVHLTVGRVQFSTLKNTKQNRLNITKSFVAEDINGIEASGSGIFPIASAVKN